MKLITFSLISFLLLAAALPGCKPKQTHVCDQIYGAYRRCDLISEGRTTCDFDKSFVEWLDTFAQSKDGRCILDCYINASCQELKSDVCEEGDTSTPQLDACQADCLAKYGFQCADGSHTISTLDKCDGWEDCADGSDEQGCPADTTFQCADGSGTLPVSYKCDGRESCADGSDEQGCPADTTFQCADGSRTIPASYKCDGWENCADGSDEQGCPPSVSFSCADGSGSIPIGSRCDTELDCPDGSDEAGCAQFLCQP